MFDAWITLPRTYGLVERIFSGIATEQLDVAGAEQFLAFRSVSDFADRHQHQFLHDLGRALRFGIEGLDRFQCIAEKIEPDRAQSAGREEVEDAAAYSEFTGIHH